jgi:hypothetical protein
MVEILFNEKLKEYTFQKEFKGVKSVKRVPIKYKSIDSTRKFRTQMLKEEIL